MKRGLTFADWLVENPPPSLADLIQKHGTFIDVPDTVLDKFYHEVEAWRDRLRNRDRG